MIELPQGFNKKKTIEDKYKPKEKIEPKPAQPKKTQINLNAVSELNRYIQDWTKEVLIAQIEAIMTANNDPQACCEELEQLFMKFRLKEHKPQPKGYDS